jgi:hypothetical protein
MILSNMENKTVFDIKRHTLFTFQLQGAFELPSSGVLPSDLNARQILYEYWAR